MTSPERPNVLLITADQWRGDALSGAGHPANAAVYDPVTAHRPEVDGSSLLRLAHGGSGGVREYLHGEHRLFGQSMHWITDERHKYVWPSGDGREQPFDLRADPGERRDLAAAEPDAVARRHARLVAELDGRPEGYVDAGRLVAGRTALTLL